MILLKQYLKNFKKGKGMTLEETVKVDIAQSQYHEKALKNELSKEDLERLENTRKLFNEEVHV